MITGPAHISSNSLISMVGPSLKTHNHLTLKFLCSYGGKILPRFPDGKLRYHGGQTRVIAVHRSISFAELLVKLGELCGASVSLRCKLPTEDLDALVSITSDEDLKNLIEEYDRAASSLKIRAFLSLPKSTKKMSPPPSIASSSSSPKPHSPPTSHAVALAGNGYCTPRFPVVFAADRCICHIPKPIGFPMCYDKLAGKVPHYGYVNPSRIYLIHNGNHWQ